MAAKSGIHFKSTEALQTMSEIKSVIFDKTGTLTLGKPRVVDFTTTLEDQKFIYCFASLEKGSEHPLAGAVLNLAKIQDIQVTVYGRSNGYGHFFPVLVILPVQARF